MFVFGKLAVGIFFLPQVHGRVTEVCSHLSLEIQSLARPSSPSVMATLKEDMESSD